MPLPQTRLPQGQETRIAESLAAQAGDRRLFLIFSNDLTQFQAVVEKPRSHKVRISEKSMPSPLVGLLSVGTDDASVGAHLDTTTIMGP